MKSRRDFLKVGTFAVGGVVAAPYIIGSASAKPVQLRVQTILGAGTISTKQFEEFGALMKKQTDGEIDIVTLPLGSVVQAPDTLDACRNGILDGQYTSPVYFAGKNPAFAVLGDTLSLYPDPATRDKWFVDGDGLKLAQQVYGPAGLHFVGPVFWPAESMPMRKPVKSLEDFKGLKVRAPEGLVGDLLKSLGVSIVTLPFPEVANALQTGVLDGADMAALLLNLETGIHPTAKYSLLAKHSAPVIELSFSQAKWKTISPKLQKHITEEFAAFSERQRILYTEKDGEARKKAAAIGVELTELSAADYAKLREASLSIINTWGKRNKLAGSIVESHRAYMKKTGLLN